MRVDLAGRTAIVTGGGQGLGRAFAQALCEAGASVAIAEIDKHVGRKAAAELTAASHMADAYEVDAGDPRQFDQLVSDVLARYGRLDILVNNAGFTSGGPSERVTEEEWDRLHRVMLRGVFFCSQIAGRVMIRQGSGSIVNICSRSGVEGYAQRAVYTSVKAGLIGLTKVLGVEWARYGVRVNGINPGEIETEKMGHAYRSGLVDVKLLADRAAMARVGTPDEVARVLTFLVSDQAAYINAEVVTVDGGWLAWGGIEDMAGVF